MIMCQGNRYIKVVGVLRWLSRRPRVTGRELERIVGHAVYICIIARL